MTIPTLPSYNMPATDDLPQGRLSWELETSRAVILIHDMQTYFLDFYGPHSTLKNALIANVKRILDWARRHQVPVVYTAQPHVQSAAARGLLTEAWGPGLTVAAEHLQAIAADVSPASGDTVLTKWRYSAFQRTDLEQRLHEWGKDQLLICGVYAHIGCYTTALDAFMRDIQPFFIADAQADFTLADHLQTLKWVAGTCGRVISTEHVLTARNSGERP